jgi:hypothetical protein
MKRSPAAAFWLSLLPGLGHLYLGLTVKGIVFALLTVGLIDIVDRGAGAFGLLIPIFWLFVMLDAHRSAQAINRGAEVSDMVTGSSPKWWGGSLIVLGALFLLYNFDLFDFEWLWRFWPLALIVLGVKLLKPAPATPPAPTPPEPPSTPLDDEPPRVIEETAPPDGESVATTEEEPEASSDEGDPHERSEDG